MSDSGDGPEQLMLSSFMCLSPTLTVSSTEEVDNGDKCTSRLAQLYNNPKFSDVTLLVNGETFYAHKLLLASASDVFEQMLTSKHWHDSEKKVLTLEEQDNCVGVFGDFLRYMYSGQILLTTDSVLGLLVLADKYNVPDLKQCCSAYMSRHLVTDKYLVCSHTLFLEYQEVSTPDHNKAIIWYQYSIACSSQELQTACFTYILLNLDTVLQSPDWVYMDKENLIVLLQRSDLVVESEYVLLKAVMRWLEEESRHQRMTENLVALLPYLRFPMILPEHIAEFEESSFQQNNHSLFAPYLLSAYRYHALSIRGTREVRSEGVPKTQFMYRNYTDENYSIQVEVVRKGFRSCPRVSSKVEKPLSLPLSICSTAAERQCKMKVTFYPQGYYTTSLWNGQLNLAKSTELTKMVIAHRGGVELHEAEITVLVYAQSNGVRYADFALTEHHIFETYGTYEIENTVDVEKARCEGSEYVIDGALVLRVFVRPVTFHK